MSAAPSLLRVAVVGATGAVGTDLVELLQEQRFPLQELRPIATDASLGATVDWLGHDVPVESESELRGLDLAFLCLPAEAARDWIARALRANVACIDLSGAVADQAEVPVLAAGLPGAEAASSSPLVSSPAPGALALARALAPLGEAGIERVTATLCASASTAGREGIDTLQAESIALFNQDELPDEGPFGRRVAFDCHVGSEAQGGRIAADLGRLLGAGAAIAATWLQVPAFAGIGVQVAVDLAAATTAEEWASRLDKAPGVSLRPEGASLRDAVAEEGVVVGPIAQHPGAERTLLAWLAADPIRLATSNALALARLRAAA